MSSNIDPTCNPFAPTSTSGLDWTANTITMMVLGLLFTFSSLFVISAVTKKDDEQNITTTMNQAMMEDEKDEGEVVNDIEEHGVKKTAEEMHVFPVTNATIYFQVLMICAAIYYSMLLTNWGTPVYKGGNTAFFTPNNTSYWC